MPILIIPTVSRGAIASLTLSRAEVLSLVTGNSYFSNIANWRKIVVVFKTAIGKQKKTAVFDASLAAPTSPMVASLRSRDEYSIARITIYDFDNGRYQINMNSVSNPDQYKITLATVTPPVAVAAPTVHLISQNNQMKEINNLWMAVSGATYKVYRNITPSFTEANLVSTQAGNTFLDSDASLQYNQLYYYAVKSVKDGSDSALSVPVSIKLVQDFVTQPTLTQLSSGVYRVNFPPLPSGASLFEIEYGASETGVYDQNIPGLTGLSYDLPYTEGAGLFLRVVAYNESGISNGFGNIATVAKGIVFSDELTAALPAIIVNSLSAPQNFTVVPLNDYGAGLYVLGNATHDGVSPIKSYLLAHNVGPALAPNATSTFTLNVLINGSVVASIISDPVTANGSGIIDLDSMRNAFHDKSNNGYITTYDPTQGLYCHGVSNADLTFTADGFQIGYADEAYISYLTEYSSDGINFIPSVEQPYGVGSTSNMETDSGAEGISKTMYYRLIAGYANFYIRSEPSNIVEVSIVY